MSAYDIAQSKLKARPKKWLVTGVAGFIGSNLLEALLKLDQEVVGLDNFSTGNRSNLKAVRGAVSPRQWKNFSFVEGDIVDQKTCRQVCHRTDIVLHQAALGSVPRSISEPRRYHSINVTGFFNVLNAARNSQVPRFVFASSSSVYGDDKKMPKVESRIGQPLSPYAASKRMNEVYAEAFAKAYGCSSIGLRYFNVFGPRQDPNGSYAAVIPRWISALCHGEPVRINGDGKTSRDFCFIENVVQGNILAGTVENSNAVNQVYNIAVGERTTLNELCSCLERGLKKLHPGPLRSRRVYSEFRAGDVRHSLADISKAKQLLGFLPTHRVAQGLDLTIHWYWDHLK